MRGLLGQRRVEVLRRSLGKKGASGEERSARVFLAVMLRALDSTAANRAAAELLLGGAGERELRKVGDLRRRPYAADAVDAATRELRGLLRARLREPGGQGGSGENNVCPQSLVEGSGRRGGRGR